MSRLCNAQFDCPSPVSTGGDDWCVVVAESWAPAGTASSAAINAMLATTARAAPSVPACLMDRLLDRMHVLLEVRHCIRFGPRHASRGQKSRRNESSGRTTAAGALPLGTVVPSP